MFYTLNVGLIKKLIFFHFWFKDGQNIWKHVKNIKIILYVYNKKKETNKNILNNVKIVQMYIQ